MRHLALLAVFVMAAACSPTSAELVTASQWSSNARCACLWSLDQCRPALACSSTVQALASEGAGREQVQAGAAACRHPWPQGNPAVVGGIGPLVDAIGDVVGAVVAKLREREAVRIAVLAQAAADVAAEQSRLAQQPLPAGAP